jgi:hypothetical protein
MRGVRIGSTLMLVPVAALGVPSLPMAGPVPREVEPRLEVRALDEVDASGVTEPAVAEPALPVQPDDAPHHDSGTASDGSLVALTDGVEVPDVAVLGVTWDPGERPAEVAVRVLEGDAWSDWYALPVDDEHGPDPGTTEAAQARPGTEPMVVTGDGPDVQVRILAEADSEVEGARLEVVDPGESAYDDSAGRPAPGTALAATASPQILARSQWGADESLRGDPSYGIVRAGFVHHTVNANDYNAAQVPAIIRGIYAFHVRSRGYKDVGYNFLVDRFGRIWEGRYGGIDRAVVGAHTLGYNSTAFAMAAIGTFTTKTPPSAVLDAYGRLFAWKMTIHDVDATGPANINGETRPAISGHRDVYSTECPGDALYARLGTIRSLAGAYQGGAASLSMRRDVDNREDPDVLAVGGDGYLRLLPGTGKGLGDAQRLGGGWGNMDKLATPGDWDGDGADDFLARRTSDGALLLYPSNGRGGFRAGRQVGNGWQVISAIVPAGDWDGDGDPDLLGRRRDGTLWLYRGTGRGGFAGSVQVGRGWNSVTAIVGPGDWNGDGVPDLLARFRDGSLWLYPGRGDGAFLARSKVGVGWNVMDVIVGAGDVNGDGAVDVLARRADSGQAWLYPGNGQGGWKSRSLIGDWSAWSLVS